MEIGPIPETAYRRLPPARNRDSRRRLPRPQRSQSGASDAATAASASDAKRADTDTVSGSTTDASVWHDVTVPAGTSLMLALDTGVGSDTSRVEEPVQAHLSHAVLIDGVTAIPENSIVTGVVTDATRAGKTKGRAHLAIRFDALVPHGQTERYPLTTGAIGRTAPSEKKKDAAKIAVPAAGGAIIGGLVGGKKGALIGTAVGGGGGTAVVLTDRGEEVRMAKGATVTLKLSEPLTLRARI